MKSILSIAITVSMICVVLSACKKDSKDIKDKVPSNGLSVSINTIVTDVIIDTLKSHGVVINKGTTPPDISGIYHIEPFVCSFDNSMFSLLGQTFQNYNYRFSQQNNSKSTIRVDYTGNGGDDGSDSTATYIAGSGNLFTIFSEVKGTSGTITYVNLIVISGELGTNGIKNFQETLYLKSKTGDPEHLLIDPGNARILSDTDKFSEVTPVFAIPLGVKPTRCAFIISAGSHEAKSVKIIK